MNRWLAAFLLIVTAGALASRLPRLDVRPLHCDEAVHAVKFGELLDTGSYKYDPHEYHGPTLYYAALPMAWLAGQRHSTEVSETLLRTVPVLFSAAGILLLWLLADGLGRRATATAAVLMAASPIMFFYSRYAIHEMLLLFFTLLATGAFWRFARSGRVAWLVLAGAAVGVMHASKETFVFNGVALLVALGVAWVWDRFVDRRSSFEFRTLLRPRALLIAFLASAAVSVVLFSSFFTNAAGPIDSLRTYLPWATRAGGESVHIHPWDFYFERLLFFRGGRGIIWTEVFIFGFGLLGMFAALTGRGLGPGNSRSVTAGAEQVNGKSNVPSSAGLIRLVAVYTLALGAIYCWIPYKTPWCALGPWQGMILLAGVGVAVAWSSLRFVLGRVVLALIVLAGVVHLGWQSWRQNFDEELCYSPRNPWVYAHTVADIENLVDKLNNLAVVHPHKRQMVIQVAALSSDYWPLPWLLRHFKNVGWWDSVPEAWDSTILVLSPALATQMKPALSQTHESVGMFGLRPNVFLALYVPRDVWSRFLESEAPPSALQ